MTHPMSEPWADWREIDSQTPRDRFIILWCREDDSYWWAKWQGGMWHGVDEMGLTRDSENFTPDLWCRVPAVSP